MKAIKVNPGKTAETNALTFLTQKYTLAFIDKTNNYAFFVKFRPGHPHAFALCGADRAGITEFLTFDAINQAEIALARQYWICEDAGHKCVSPALHTLNDLISSPESRIKWQPLDDLIG